MKAFGRRVGHFRSDLGLVLCLGIMFGPGLKSETIIKLNPYVRSLWLMYLCLILGFTPHVFVDI